MPILRDTTVRRKERYTSSERTFVDSLDLDRASVKVNCRVPTSLTAYFTSISLAFSRTAVPMESRLSRFVSRFDRPEFCTSAPGRSASFMLSPLHALPIGAIFQRGRKRNESREKDGTSRVKKIFKETGSQIEREREREREEEFEEPPRRNANEERHLRNNSRA